MLGLLNVLFLFKTLSQFRAALASFGQQLKGRENFCHSICLHFSNENKWPEGTGCTTQMRGGDFSYTSIINIKKKEAIVLMGFHTKL